MNLIELGVPGAGKGTQAKLLSEHFHITHISSGEALRQAAQQDTPKGQLIRELLATGELLPFDTVLEVITDLIKNSPDGFILDGTPRDLAQAEHMDWFFETEGIAVDHVLYYDLPDEIALERLLHRAEDSGRSDDTPETFKKRLEVYHQQTEPIIDHYRYQGKLIEIDARPSIEEIFQNTLQRLSKE